MRINPIPQNSLTFKKHNLPKTDMVNNPPVKGAKPPVFLMTGNSHVLNLFK
jgi:hypothetical protein